MDDAAFAMAMADYQAGRLAAAAERCRSALDRDPVDADSLHLLGVIAVDQGDHRTGIDLIRAAMAARPGFAPQFNSLGNALRHQGRLQEAEAAYRQAAALRPDSVEIESNLGFALRGLGRPREAIAHYERAASLAPEVPRVWLNLGNALAVTGRSSEAETCYRRAIALQPDSAEAIGGFGRWLAEIGRWPQAEKLLTEALRLIPGDAGLWTALGAVRQELGQPDSEACYQRAIAIDPRMGAAHYNLGRLRFQHGDSAAALACFVAAAIADPDQGLARLAACIARLPILFRSEAEVASCRAAYAAALDGLAAEASACLAPAIGRVQPFFLPYQGLDDRDLQTTYGQLACRVVAQAEPPAPLAERPGPGERIRIGIVSGFFCDHTLFKLFLEGWLTQIDRTRFEVIGFRTGNVMDQRTALCAGWCDRFVQELPSAAWRDAIIDVMPHVLLYPEVGIDPIAGRLAAMRLAPIQCVAWGHPVTTGMPTIDLFLTSDMMEPPGADRFYTERLIPMPNLGLWYQPEPDVDPASKSAGGSSVIFWSGQALYKYHPRYDTIFPRIAAEVRDCRFVFIGFAKSPHITDAFHDRLRGAFAAAGLDADHYVTILPPMSQTDFLQAAGQADIILDTPGWSGGKSTLDCLALDPAIVTLQGDFMRGRHTAAILQRIDAVETIASSVDDYVSIAVRLARDPAWRASVRRTVAMNKHRAFRDDAYIRALETVLTEEVQALL